MRMWCRAERDKSVYAFKMFALTTFTALHALRVFQHCMYHILANFNKFDSRGQPRFLGADDMLILDQTTL